MKKNLKRINLHFDPEDYKRVGDLAEEEGITRSKMIRDIIKAYLGEKNLLENAYKYEREIEMKLADLTHRTEEQEKRIQEQEKRIQEFIHGIQSRK